MDEKGRSTTSVKSKTDYTSWRTTIAKIGLFLLVIGLISDRLLEGVRLRLGSHLGEVESGNGQIVRAWRWNEIIPSHDLIWHQCFEKYDCARIEVPLDWLHPEDRRRVAIAMIRYNATDRADYKGPVFINPGGPGGSGVWFMKHLAPYYQSVVGKNHDIVSFDPRGIGATTPQISCWNSSIATSSSLLWGLQEPPVLDAYPGTVYDAYAYAAAFSQQCASQIAEIGKFVSTVSVARDMLHMVDRIGEKGLKYWGFSYGTYLGVTFASLFPDKIERMVNDGNVDAKEYVSGAGSHFLLDTDAVMNSFYAFCYKAGPDACAFHSNSPSAIEIRLEALLSKIKHSPIIVSALPSSNQRPEIVNYSQVRKLISGALYQPITMFPPLAKVFSALEKGNGRPFVELTSGGGESLPLCDNHNTEDPNDPPEWPELEGSSDAGKAILCSDSAPVKGGVDGFGAYVEKLIQESKVAGATMASMLLGCVEWGIESKWQFRGPFEGNTSHPILFIGNTADNVTPLRSALRNSQGFPGSVVLVQDSYGHTSLSTPSRCTARNIRTYFQDGTLPAPGTKCAADVVPFDTSKVSRLSDASQNEGCDEEELDKALWELTKVPGFGML